MKKYDGRCPQCNKKLGFSSSDVTITPHDEKRADAS